MLKTRRNENLNKASEKQNARQQNKDLIFKENAKY